MKTFQLQFDSKYFFVSIALIAFEYYRVNFLNAGGSFNAQKYCTTTSLFNYCKYFSYL